MAIYKHERLGWHEIDALQRYKTVVILSLCPIEVHGPHLPCGMDFYATNDFTELAVQTLETQRPDFNWVLYPSIPLGCTDLAAELPGTVSISERTLKWLLVDIFESIMAHGFRYIAISNHHFEPKHLNAIRMAIKMATTNKTVRIIEPLGELFSQSTDLKSIYGFDPPVDMEDEIHAGFQDTSYMIYKHPEMVNPLYVNLKPFIVGTTTSNNNLKLTNVGATHGLIGNPSMGTLAFGKCHFESCGRKLVEGIVDMIDRERHAPQKDETNFISKVLSPLISMLSENQ
jgi:creatinine amidohydrolase